MSETGLSKSAMLAQAARRRLRGLAAAAARMGAQPPPKAGEPIPEGLQEGDSPDAMDLPLGVYPVGGRPQQWVQSETDLPGEQIPAQMQGRAAVDAIAEAAAELGLKPPGVMFFVPDAPGAPAVLEPPLSPRGSPRVVCCLTGHSREQISDGMVEAFVEAASAGMRRTDKRYVWLDKARLACWDEAIAEPPRTDGLRERLAAAASAGDGAEDDLHDLAWFGRVAGRVEEAAFDAGALMYISCVAVRPSGFQVAADGVPPTALRESGEPDTGHPYSIRLYCHHYNPAEFADHVIDAVLYGNRIGEDAEEHASLGRALRAAAVARFTIVPSAPPAG